MKKYFSLLTLIVLILILSVGGASSQPPASTLTLPGDDLPGPAAYNQQQPAVSLGGNQSLVAWTDYRTGGDPNILDEGGADIFAARVASDGTLLDTTPLLLSMGSGNQTNPKIAWNGENWLVIWLSQGQTQFFWSSEIQGVRISPTGQVLDPTPISIYQYPFSTGAEAEVASDGNNWSVIFRGTSAGEAAILGVRVAPSGTVLDPNGIVLRPSGGPLTFNLDLAFAVDEYLLTYYLSGNLLAQRFTTALQPIDTNPFTVATGGNPARVASNGTDFFVAWRLYNSGTQYGETRGSRISYAGQVLDPGGLTISGLMFIGAVDPRVAWDGTNWVVTYKGINIGPGDLDTLLASRVTPSGTVLDVGGINIEPVTTVYSDFEIDQAPGGGLQAVWADIRAGGWFPKDASSFPISTTLTVGAPSVVSYSAPAQTQPNIATSSSGSMLVFHSAVSGENRIKAHPLDANGLPLLTEPVTLATGPTLNTPAVAWNGTYYFVVWSDTDLSDLNNSIVYGQRLNPDGTFVDPTPITLMEGFSTDVAAVGSNFLVVAIQQTLNIEVREPYGIRVDGTTGAILGSPLDLGGSFAQLPSVASMGDRWLVAYQRNYTHDDPNAQIDGAIVMPDGTINSAITISTGLGSHLYDPDIASDGTDAFVAWLNDTTDDINGGLVLNNGTVQPSIVVNGQPERQDAPAIGWDGTQYVVLYQDVRNITFFLDERSDIYGSLVSGGGVVSDPVGFGIFTEPYSEIHPAATGANGVAILAAGDFRDELGYMSYRISYNLLGSSLPTPTPTNTSTATQTPTTTNTPTMTPTATNTPSPTATSTITPSPTATEPPTATPTASETPPTPTATATSPSGDPSPTPTSTTVPPEPNFQVFIPVVIR